MKQIVKFLFENIVLVLDFIIPKNKQLIIFGSNGGRLANGNPKIIFDYFLKHETRLQFYYFLNKDSVSLEEIPDEKLIIKKYFSFKAFYLFLRAKVLIGSHGPEDFLFTVWSKRKKHIQTWHGIPLKAMGYALKKTLNHKKLEKYIKRIDAFVTASEIEAALITRCFHIKSNKVFLTGHPRILELQQKTDCFSGKVPNYSKIILYAPTHRDNREVLLFPFSDFDKKLLGDFLEKHKLLLLVRQHINDDDEVMKGLFANKRIIDFNFSFCPDVNRMLSMVDILITDYSSIYFDFLMLDRPILFFPYDIDDYRKVRGMLLDNYDFWAPGKKINSFSDFLKSLDDLSRNEDSYRKERHLIRSILHKYNDNDIFPRFMRLLESFIK